MSESKNKMTQDDKARIQSSQALGGKNTGTGGFAARAQSAADKNSNKENAGSGKGTAGANGTSNGGTGTVSGGSGRSGGTSSGRK